MRAHVRKQPVRWAGVGAALAAAALGLAACSSAASDGPTTTSPPAAPSTGPAAGGGTSTPPPVPPSSVPPPAGLIVAPADVAPIVRADTSVNNRANATLSVPLQDSHEACLQQEMDDINFRADQSAGVSIPAFDQVPSTAYVPRQSAYPASFSVLVQDYGENSKGQRTGSPTPTLLTYSKVTASSTWKLVSSSQILGPTPAGVAVPAVRTDAGGYASALPYGQVDGLIMAPSEVAARVAAAFTAEARSGVLPAGVTAEFGPAGSSTDPHQLVQGFAALGRVSVTFSTTPPAAVAPSSEGLGCQYPAYRLAGGGALVVFPIFQVLSFAASSASGISQPADRSRFGVLLSPGTYASVRTVVGDVCVAVVPPAGSHAPVQVIGSGMEEVIASGEQGGLVIT